MQATKQMVTLCLFSKILTYFQLTRPRHSSVGEKLILLQVVRLLLSSLTSASSIFAVQMALAGTLRLSSAQFVPLRVRPTSYSDLISLSHRKPILISSGCCTLWVHLPTRTMGRSGAFGFGYVNCDRIKSPCI